MQVLADQFAEKVVRQPGVANAARLPRQALHGFPLAGIGIAVADGIHESSPDLWPEGLPENTDQGSE
ncbi:hypothetical protein D9M69_712140 [compost metagenome]